VPSLVRFVIIGKRYWTAVVFMLIAFVPSASSSPASPGRANPSYFRGPL